MTTPTKHTPEPWVYQRNCAYWEFGAELDGFVSHRLGDVCATDPSHPDSGKQEANARRIVACVNGCAGINPEAVPELVKALEAIDTMPVDGVSPFVIESMLRQAKAMAYTALAKAKGGVA